jgi:hypothetical protein
MNAGAGRLRAAGVFFWVAYATAVILFTTYPWNILLLAFIVARRGEQVRGERQEADISPTPTWVLERSSFVSAGRAPSAPS